jgi:hypothetical protein
VRSVRLTRLGFNPLFEVASGVDSSGEEEPIHGLVRRVDLPELNPERA